MMQHSITIGVVGHPGHGKTALTRCLTGFASQSLSTEVPPASSGGGEISPVISPAGYSMVFIDLPGQGPLKKKMAGLAAVDLVILTIAADDGVMPGTTADLELLRCLDIQFYLPVLTKIDSVDDGLRQLARQEINEAVRDLAPSAISPTIPFSTKTARGAQEIIDCLEKAAQMIPPKSADAPFRLWIDRTSSPSGIGTVACGTILSGRIHENDPLVVLPDKLPTRARSLEVHHQPVVSATAGQRVGINLPGIRLTQISGGKTLAQPDKTLCSYFINAQIHELRPLWENHPVMMYLGTGIFQVKTRRIVTAPSCADDSILVQLQSPTEVAAVPGDRFLLTLPDTDIIIGGGSVLEISFRKYRPSCQEETLPYLKALQFGTVIDILKAYLYKNRGRFISIMEIATATGRPDSCIRQCLQTLKETDEVLELAGKGLYLKTVFKQLTDDIIAASKQKLQKNPLNPIICKEEMRPNLSFPIDDDVFHMLLDELLQTGAISRYQHGFTIPGLDCPLPPRQRQLADDLLKYGQKMELSPFTAGGFCKNNRGKYDKKEVLSILDYLSRQGDFIHLGGESYIPRTAIETIKIRIQKAAAIKKHIHLTDSHALLGYGRTKATPVFEYLDTIGFTIRQGDYRILTSEQRCRKQDGERHFG